VSNSTRYGIIGAGMMAQEHIRNIYLLEGASVTAVCDPVQTSLSWSESTLRGIDGADLSQVQYFTDHRDMLASGAVDALIIASPNFTHIDVLRDTLQTDLPHLVEKPLCTTLEDALEIEERVKGFDPVFWVGLEYRYMPPVARMIERAHAGDVGAMKMLSIREHRFPFLPKVGNWNRFNANSGGTFVEKCCHFFDLMRLILKSDPVRVMASAGQEVNHLDEVYDGRASDIWDSGYVIVDFASGARGMLELSMFAEGSEYQEMVHAVGAQGKLEVKIPGPARFWSGPEAARPVPLLVESRRHPCNPVVHQVPIDAAILDAGDHNGSTFYQHQRFLDVVRGRGSVEVSLEDGIWAVRMGQAAQQSAATGKAVTF